MSVYEKLTAALQSNDADAFVDLLHDDFEFVRHQSGTSMNKAEMAEMVGAMSGEDGWSIENQRCVYENDDILVEHSFMSFPDGSREAVLTANTLKDGKIVRMESGASLLK